MPYWDKPSVAAKSIKEAAAESPALSRLSALITQSNEFLATIESLVPKDIYSGVRPGAYDGENWCLLANNPTVAAKLRHLLPDIQRMLRQTHAADIVVRIKVMQP